MKMEIGGVELTTPQQEGRSPRFTLLLWGAPGCGKTTLAATAPKKCLWINYDDNGTRSLADFDEGDVLVLDLSSKSNEYVAIQAKKDDPYDIGKFLKNNEDVKTIVVDSMTSFGERALDHAIPYGLTQVKTGEKPTIERPGLIGHGNKNTWTRLLTRNMLRVANKYNRHIIFICHEDKPEKDKQGNILHISIMLGSSLNIQVPKDLSETWWMRDDGRYRWIAIRPCRSRMPMKTRMFISESPEFPWKFDPVKQTGDTIEGWLEQWSKNDGKKIQAPVYKK